MTPEFKTLLEWTALLLNAVFIILLIRENIWCWLFGIVASIISVALFFDAKLYSETLLYSVYVVLGVYAWINWKKHNVHAALPIVSESGIYHRNMIGIGVVVWFGLGYFFKNYTDSNLPWADACTTSFAFVATYLEAKKVLHHWIYWIFVNLFSIWLYYTKELPVLAMMMFGFAVFSVIGYISWSKRLARQKA